MADKCPQYFLIDCYFTLLETKGQHSLFKVAHFTLKETLNLLTIVLKNSGKEHWLLLKTATWCLITILALFFKTTIPHTWGGAIYVDKLSQYCFILFSKVTSLMPLRYENATIQFINNTSVNGGDDVYGAILMLYNSRLREEFF